jgi:hypothetical protein
MRSIPLGQAVTVLLVFSFPAALSAANITFSPSAQSVSLGDSASVDVVVSNLDQPPYLGDFDLTVSFDSTILSLPNSANVTFGSLLGDPVAEAISGESDGTGSVEFFEVSLLSPTDLAALQNGSSAFTIATLTFGTIGAGTSALSFSNVT